jgi:hypothetical protein
MQAGGVLLLPVLEIGNSRDCIGLSALPELFTWIAGSIEKTSACPIWERSRAVSSLTAGALVISSIDSIGQQVQGNGGM